MSSAEAAYDYRPSILVVDDDAVFCERLARAFVDRGFDARPAATFADAVAAALEDPPEYAVVDLRIARHSGLELLRELIELDPATRVAILTGYVTAATAIEALQLGAVCCLSKPLDADDILKPLIGEAAPPEDPEQVRLVLAACGGDVSDAARRLKMHRRLVQRELARHGLDDD